MSESLNILSTDITERKQLKGKMHESEQRFRAMLDALPTAIYITDAKGLLTYYNPAAVEFSGHVPELGTAQWCVSWKLYYPDGTPMPHSECPMAIALKEGRLIRGAEAIAERPDGKRIWFVPYPTPLRDSGGRIVAGINMLVDITERKLAEKTRAHLAAIVESSDDAIVSKTLQGIITTWNRGAEKLFGYTAEEAIDKSITMLIPPEWIHEETQILDSIKRGERVDHYETVRQRKDGTYVDISLTVSPIRGETGQIIGASKIARDISERKRIEQELIEYARKQDALYELVDRLHHTSSLDHAYHAAMDAIFRALQCHRASILLFDDTGVMRFVAWRGLSEDYRKATEGHSPWKPDTINPEVVCINDVNTADISAALKDVIRAEGIGSLAFIPLVTSGRLLGKFMVYFDWPHVFSKGELELSLVIAHHVAFSIDRTGAEGKLRESREQLQMLNETLEQRVKERTAEVRKLASELTRAEHRERHRISQVLHDDLQQRLYAIQMQMSFLRDGIANTETSLLEEFEAISNQFSEITQLTRHLSIDLSPPILHNEGLAQAIHWLSSQMNEQYELSVNLSAEEPFTIPDRDLQVLLYNCIRELLFNIVKHAGVKQAWVELKRNNGDLQIEVRDEGKGFHIAGLGKSVHKSFGLPTLRYRLSVLGGHMHVQSQPATGTCVTLTIPVHSNGNNG
jgi:PAS domain S-box-containing protein